MRYFYVFIFLLSSQLVMSQKYLYGNYNRLGVQGGVTFTSVLTSDLNMAYNQGFTVGLSTRSAVFNNTDLVYGINFFKNNTGIFAAEQANQDFTAIDFNYKAVQINMFVAQRLIGHYLSIEGGPVLQLNSKWEADKENKEFIIDGYNLLAEDIEEISKINFNVAGGLAGGNRNFKIWVYYQYGVTNILGNLNEMDLTVKDPQATNFKGNQSMLLTGLVIYL